MSYRHGNDRYFAEIPDGPGFCVAVEIWENIGLGQSEVIANASDKFSALKIIDALIEKDKK